MNEHRYGKIGKRIIKWFLFLLIIPFLYWVISLTLSAITIQRKIKNQVFEKTIFLSTNGIHLDIVIPKSNLNGALVSGLYTLPSDEYLAFGWGDENFYIHTPTWGDLTFKNAFKAVFLKSSTLMHVTRYNSKGSDWIEIKISESELEKLNQYLQSSFKTNQSPLKLKLENQGYTATDDFYKAKGSYSFFNTCNSWVNRGFKKSGLKSCLWTPFDFGLIKKYE